MRASRAARLLLFILLALSSPAMAVDVNPGDACTGFVAGDYRLTGGRNNPDGAFVVCDGGIWQPILRYSSSGNAVMFASTGLAAAPLQVWGEAIIGSNGLACTAPAEGALRYTSSSDAWEYCNGNIWTALARGSGGVLDDLSDVSILSPAEAEVLTYESASGQWVSAPSNVVAINALNDISDVNAPVPSTGQVLKWNGSAWIADTDAGGASLWSDSGAGYIEYGLAGTGIKVEATAAATPTFFGLSDLSDHTANQNVRTSGFWLSNDGDNEGLFIDATGQVGIGTGSPGANLHIKNASGSAVARVEGIGGDANLNLFSGNNWTLQSINADGRFRLYDSSNALEAFTVLSGSGNVGIGTNSPASKMQVLANSTNTAANYFATFINGNQSTANTGNYYSTYIDPTYNAAGTLAGQFGLYALARNIGTGTVTTQVGVYGLPRNDAGGTVSTMVGLYGFPRNLAAGTVTTMYGGLGFPRNEGSGTVTSMMGLAGVPNKLGTGAVTNMYGLYSKISNGNATGAITNGYGLFLATPDTTGAITSLYGIYQQHAGSDNYFAGNVGIGVNNPRTNLDIDGRVQVTDTVPRIKLNDSDHDADYWIEVDNERFYILADRENENLPNSGWEAPHPLELRAVDNTGFLFGSEILTNGTASTVDFSGNVRVNSPSSSSPGSGNTNTGIVLNTNNIAYFSSDTQIAMIININGIGRRIDFKNSGTLVGSVGYNGSATTFNTSSDRRLKEKIEPTSSGLQNLMAINVYDFNFIKSPKTRVNGFIAQELYDIYPEAVQVGGEDPETDPWSVDYGRLTPLIVKAVQDIKTEKDQEIATLRAENALLKEQNLRQQTLLHDIDARLNTLESTRARDTALHCNLRPVAVPASVAGATP